MKTCVWDQIMSRERDKWMEKCLLTGNYIKYQKFTCKKTSLCVRLMTSCYCLWCNEKDYYFFNRNAPTTPFTWALTCPQRFLNVYIKFLQFAMLDTWEDSHLNSIIHFSFFFFNSSTYSSHFSDDSNARPWRW